MVTDDERRRVAAALRDKYRERESGRWFIPQMEGMYERDYLKDLESCLPDGKSMFTVLADLIEPSEPQVKRELKYRARCDELGAEMKRQRDALLKLADEMETADPEDLNVAIDYITECASRISEALGADDGR